MSEAATHTTRTPTPASVRSRGADPIEAARRAGVLSVLDQQFATRLVAIFGETDESVRWAAALVCRQSELGHVCADLPRLARDGLASEESGPEERFPVLATQPTLEAWLAAVAASPLVASIGADPRDADDGKRPLVLDAAGRLYLRRLDRAERDLARSVAERARRPHLEATLDAKTRAGFDDARAIDSVLAERLDPTDPAPLRALEVGLARPLAILTGGPGTGKTTLVARLVRLLALQAIALDGRPPRVLLLAPTGKAAAAMAASFARERGAPGLEAVVRDALPMEAETIHRALARLERGRRSGASSGFDADVVVVDEASMVDLEQMARLFAACEAVPRLVLLGDPRQLASVEAGAVLADLCGEDDGSAPLPELERGVVRLTKSHRYAAGGGIGRLAEAVRAGDADSALAILADPGVADVARCDVVRAGESTARLAEAVRRLERAVAAETGLEAKLARLGDYRVLCAHRRGPFGVEALSRALDEVAALERRTSSRAAEWPGRLLLVTRNAPEQGLWNGDVGLVEALPGGLRALFSDPRGGVRTLSLARLPAHESAIAMSVHKSQGSEFETVDLVLGARVTRLMTRELLYTGITRARSTLRIHASEAVLRAAIARRAHRDSGLVDRLKGR
jgi:exodeoxyribonuclease V alpha subunit